MAVLDDALRDLRQTVATLEQKLEERTAERDEALAQQTATGEILRAIARSPTDLQPVFEGIVRSAARVCEAEFSAVARSADGLLHLVAVYSMSPEETAAFHSLFPRAPARSFVMGRAFADAQPVHAGDVLSEPDYDTRTLDVLQSVAKYRSFLGVPILREGKPIGVIGCGRREVKPFTATQIELLETFADQAAIAIENVRLFNELETRNHDVSEALAQQTATAEVLGVINSSPGDLEPVFQAIVEKAHTLCSAACGSLQLWDGEKFRGVAMRGFSEPMVEALRRGYSPSPNHPCRLLLDGERIAHCIDMAEVDDPVTREGAKLSGIRTVLYVALHKHGALLGQIVAGRQEVRPFTEKEIALLQNFAAQAVIAMENARLLTETREALEQQTATAEVLGVINSSPGDLAPVFDAMLEKAHSLCGISMGSLELYDGQRFRAVAVRGLSEAFADMLREGYPASENPATRPLIEGERFSYIADMAQADYSIERTAAETEAVRTLLCVPLRREGQLLGMIASARKEVRPFSEKEVALLENFAAQAVIAMENARLITETREALEQQTATAEVLGVINSSPGDLAPVFDAMLEKAMRLCEATYGHLVTFDGELIHIEALTGDPRLVDHFRNMGPVRPPPKSVIERMLGGEDVVHIQDTANDLGSRVAGSLLQALADIGGTRSLLGVALRKDRSLAGAIVVYRQEIRPFTEKQIALLQNFAAQAVIAMENARLITETREALEQQTATAEVLGVINSSPGDLAPVFDAMLEKAISLCDATLGHITTFDGELFHHVATRGDPDLVAFLRQTPALRASTDSITLGRIIRGDRFVHIPDCRDTDEYREKPVAREIADRGGMRTLLTVPLRKEDGLLGTIHVYRKEVRPFTDKQIALLQNFAAQAVIAMENARLITETREALEQQTATAEVLGVINSSPGDLTPVFDAMLEKATRLSEAGFGCLQTYDGTFFHVVATRGPPEFEAWSHRLGPLDPQPGTTIARLAQGERTVQVVGLAESEAYREGASQRRAVVDIGGFGTILSIALHKDNVLLGALHIFRKEVRPFTDKQTALLQNFAAQAVIAMENARLITETQEALEQQTALAEVLGVINSSPGDLAPVFDALLEKAMKLCEATFGGLTSFDGKRFHTLAMRGLPTEAVEAFREPWVAGPGSYHDNLVRGEPLVHTDFGVADPARLAHPQSRAIMGIGKARTGLIIALRKDERLLGSLFFYRQEVRPFTDKQISLLLNFAAQAVIAMENARLITETREALEQQTATGEVLQVINSSPGDLAPVFDAILEKAHALCDAPCGSLQIFDGELFRAVATRGLPEAYATILRRGVRSTGVDPGAIVQFDFAERAARSPDDQNARIAVEVAKLRTVLFVPLRKDDVLVGRIAAGRQEARPFTDKQIALLQNFAQQAVIAMENARLITETREALEQQTATAEVLQVINSSPGDLAPVFDAMLVRALRLCKASFGVLSRIEGNNFSGIAVHGAPPELADALRQPRQIVPGNAHYRLVHGEDVVQIEDITADDVYRSGNPARRALADLGGARTVLWVALRKEAAALGAFVVYRTEVRPFTDKQIALLENFAAQAVIAIENARLITETREALDQQTATAEVLGVISSSPGDLAPVFDAILEKAHTLCKAAYGALLAYDGEFFRAVAWRDLPAPFLEIVRQPFRHHPDNPMMRLVRGEGPVQVCDLAQAAPYFHTDDQVGRAAAEVGRVNLMVPLRKDSTLLGVITANRWEAQPFSDKQIGLLENFAAQAVIAMENARLISETREALEQQTATAEVLQVINASPGNLEPIFQAIVEKAHTLCSAACGSLQLWDGEKFHGVAMRGFSEEMAEGLRRGYVPGPNHPCRPLLAGERVAHCADLAEIDDPVTRAGGVALGGVRTILFVALRKDDALLGQIVAARQEVRPFTEKEIALVENFAAQAVIAMENARLLTETREALEQQTATSEVLQVINSSPGDLAPVFEAMLEKAHTLCGADHGSLQLYDGANLYAVATHNVSDAFADVLRRGYRAADSPVSQALIEGSRFAHVANSAEIDHPVFQAAAKLSGIGTVLFVPLRKDGALLGLISAARREVRAFTDKQIALLQNFAAQAVIAMENARLITETREALEQQTATSEVLGIINSSPGDLAPVFKTMLEKAVRLCDFAFAALWTYDGANFHPVALHGVPKPFEAFMREHVPPAFERLVRGGGPMHFADIMATEIARRNPVFARAAQELAGVRALLLVPLRKDDALLGVVAAYRQEARPFSDKQIALLQNFAQQAVIAMENARLITETREALEQQTATAEVLQVINSSPGDLAPVFDAILEKAHSVCEASIGGLWTYDGERFHFALAHGIPEPLREFVERNSPGPGTGFARLASGESLVHIVDAQAHDVSHSEFARAFIELGGARTVILVALRKDERLLGGITAYRQEVRPFTDKQIALLQNFAAQAVIAMENARLLDEIRQRQAELRVTFDNMADGVVRFDEELRLAAWNRNLVEILDLPDAFLAEPRTYADYVRYLAKRGEFGEVDPEAELRRLTENSARHWTPERTRPDGRVIEVRHSPVPGGGFVLIYSDITERKRAEARLRAARDTAEAALRELKTAQASLVHAEKMASLGQLTAGIAHEIKNPLNFVNNFAGLSVELLDELKEAAAPAVASLGDDLRAEIDEIVGMLTGNLEKIAEHGRRADGIVKSMLAHSRGGSGERQAVDINSLVDESLNLAYHGARAQDQNFNIILERDLDRGMGPVELVPQDVTRVFLNLFGNGFYAANKRCSAANDPQFEPSLKVSTRDLGAEVEIRVRDNGTGIPPEVKDKLFQPFFTTKPTGEGTGLGLSISYDIVTQQHGGTITVDSRVGEFTEFTVRLPRGRHVTTTGRAI